MSSRLLEPGHAVYFDEYMATRSAEVDCHVYMLGFDEYEVNYQNGPEPEIFLLVTIASGRPTCAARSGA